MSTMKGIIKVMPYGDEDCTLPFVEVSSGELWVHVLQVLGCLIFCTISLFNLSFSVSLVSSLSQLWVFWVVWSSLFSNFATNPILLDFCILMSSCNSYTSSPFVWYWSAAWCSFNLCTLAAFWSSFVFVWYLVLLVCFVTDYMRAFVTFLYCKKNFVDALREFLFCWNSGEKLLKEKKNCSWRQCLQERKRVLRSDHEARKDS